MFDRKTYSQMRRAGFGLGISKEKLNELADSEGCSVNVIVSKLIKTYKKTKA